MSSKIYSKLFLLLLPLVLTGCKNGETYIPNQESFPSQNDTNNEKENNTGNQSEDNQSDNNGNDDSGKEDDTSEESNNNEQSSIKVNSIALNITSKRMEVSESFKLIATVNPTNANNKNLKWESSNENVVSVEDGTIKAISPGECVIKVTSLENPNIFTCCEIIVVYESIFKEPEMNKQVYLNSLGDVYSVWEKYRGQGTTIAVIDTGFDLDHQEFKYKDGTSKISAKSAYFTTNGWNTTIKVGKENCGLAQNKDSHGTICASVAAGSATGVGTVGIAPNAELMFLKTDNKPKSICKAFEYAADNGAKVITISVGDYSDYSGELVNDGSDLTSVFNDSVKYAYDKGVVICSAAGNGGESRGTEYTYPGAVPNVIGCGGIAYNEDETVWSGSSYNSGPNYVFCDIFAPSENIYNGAIINGQHCYINAEGGTSFSSPMVAGAAALYFSKYPNKSNKDFESDLYKTAVTMADSKNTGHGRMDIGALLGETKTGNIKLQFEVCSSWKIDNCISKIYLWNSKTGENNAFPGAELTVDTLISLEKYDKAIISRWTRDGYDGNSRTINLSLYAFNYCSGYKLTEPSNGNIWYDSVGPLIGNYII